MPFWHPGTAELIQHLKEHAIEALAYDYFNAHILDNTGKHIELLPFIKNTFLKKLVLKIGRNYFFKKHIRPTDILDIHFVDGSYNRLIKMISPNTKLVATLFGSDLFRTNNSTKQLQKPIFNRANLILMSDNMKPFFEEHFPGNTPKIYHNQYGSNRIDLVHEQFSTSNKINLKLLAGIDPNKIVITCGYNAKEEQQHSIMLQQLQQLKKADKEKIYLLFPLTYGKKEPYFSKLIEEIKQLDIAYKIYDSKLSDAELVHTKIISDITLNTQTTDALASSIKEAFVANNILIVADWLPYNIYADLGLYYITSDKNTFTNNISMVINDMPKYDELVKENATKIVRFASWKKLIPDWIEMYNRL